MRIVDPKVFVIGEMTRLPGLTDMLMELGAPEWDTDAATSNEALIETAGRLCYKSFGVGLNANVTKVRDGNAQYIENVLKQKHGSVIEHAITAVAFLNVSRIFTHELVRHRQGVSPSQESMRFVRLDNIPMYVPDLTGTFEDLSQIIHVDAGVISAPGPIAHTLQKTFTGYMEEITELAERRIKEFADMLDHPKVPFHIKKVITSALRRMAPGGHTTNIIITANHRAWRHMIDTRTSPGAEIEIRHVFGAVAQDFKKRYPALYQDMTEVPDLEGSHYMFSYQKV